MLRGIQNASRNWLGRVVMGVVMGLIAVSFAIWGIGDIFRGFGQSTVAKVGGTEIRIETFRQLYQDRLQQLSRSLGRPILPDQARALRLDRDLLEQVIIETVVDERARALRLGLTDAEVARRITENEAFRSITGQFDRVRFEQLIRGMGYTEARFVDEQRRSAVRQQLLGAIGGDPGVPRTALDALNRFRNEQRTVEYVALGPAQAGDVPPPTPEELTKYFEARKVVFRAPEYRKIVLVVLLPENLTATIEVSDADLKRAYEDRKARYETPERRHVQQIVFPNMDEARAGADKIAKGMTYAALAAERGLKESDIDLGTVAKTAIVDRAVGDAAFALKAGEVSAPVEGRFGPALIQVLKIEPPQTRPLDQVAAELRREIATDRARNELINVQEKIEDERLSGVTLADSARKFGLTPRVIDAIDRTGRGPDGKQIENLPQGVDVLAAAFAADVGGDNESLRIPGTGYVWYDVMEVVPSRDRTLDEVKALAEERWRNDEIASRVKAKSESIVDRIKGGKSFNEVAAEERLKVEWRPGLKRGSPPPGFSATTVDEVFKTAKDSAAAVDGSSPTERIVFRVTEITTPALDPQASDFKELDQTLRQATSVDLIAQYVARLRSEIGVSINESALSQVAGGSARN
ncbi:MAG: peptidylprolyl isomerase [Alphaproteobacteria bacterium]|nr:peptidylprolyl isomerase [Alphaproteobacteria bacterium]